jgi:hypothetical protein
MSDLQLFIVGVVVAIPAGASMIALVLAAIADGRENDRIHAQQAKTSGDAE